jgi:hypothetical protein
MASRGDSTDPPVKRALRAKRGLMLRGVLGVIGCGRHRSCPYPPLGTEAGRLPRFASGSEPTAASRFSISSR